MPCIESPCKSETVTVPLQNVGGSTLSATSNDVRGVVFSGAELRSLRVAAGLTQTTLADRIGRSVYTVAAYERGQQQPTAESLGNMAAVLGCTVSEFYTESGVPQP